MVRLRAVAMQTHVQSLGSIDLAARKGGLCRWTARAVVRAQIHHAAPRADSRDNEFDSGAMGVG